MFVQKTTAVFLAILPLLGFAQADKSNYALLWEISGNGLTKPSYLFGTMHVEDVRAFEFSDSVLLKLDACDAFAMEVHPNTALSYFTDLSVNGDTSNVLRTLLSEVEYARVDSIVRAQTGVPIDSLDVKDPMLLEMLLSDFEEPEDTEKKDFFLDLYLFRLAFLQGKPVYGLENIKQHRNLNRIYFRQLAKVNGSASDTEAAYYEQLLTRYRSGDLTALRDFMNLSPMEADYEFELLTRRNRTMASVLEGHIRRQSVFCAVGVAHLPGETGLIQLLREKGYRLRRVTPAFNGLADRYQEKRVERPWFAFENPLLGYSVTVPEEPFPLSLSATKGSKTVEGYLYSDILSSSNYLFLCGVGLTKEAQRQPLSELVRSLLDSFRKNAATEIVKKRAVRQSGLPGEELLTRDEDGGYSQWQVYRSGDRMYLFGIFQPEMENAPDHARRYFESIRFFDPRSSSWTPLTSETGAFAIEFPIGPTYQRSKLPYDDDDAHRYFTMNGYIAKDPNVGATFVVYAYDQPAGVKIEDERQTLENLLAELESSWGRPREKTFTTLHGYPACIARFRDRDNEKRIWVIQRGNRQYRILSEAPVGQIEQVDVDRFFHSFTLRPLAAAPLSVTAEPEANFRISVPGPWFVERAESNAEDYPLLAEQTLYTLDTLSGVTYLAIEYSYSPYFRLDDPETMFASIRDRYTEQEGTRFVRDTVVFGRRAIYGAESEALSRINTHRLFFLEGPFLYELVVQLPDSIDWPLMWDFFRSFSLSRSFPADYLTRDKTATLFEDLRSDDARRVAGAKREMDHFPFSTTDLPAIYALLERDFPGDTLGEQTIHDLVFREFRFTRDATTLPFLAELFARRQGNPEGQAAVLHGLAGLWDTEAYALLFTLATQFRAPGAAEMDYAYVLLPMLDSMALAARHIPQLAALRTNETMRYPAYRVLYELVRADSIDTRAADRLSRELLADARRIIRQYRLLEPRDSLDEFPEYWTFDALNIILGELTLTPDLQAYLQDVQRLPDARLLVTAVDNLLMNDLPVARSTLDRVFQKPLAWYILLGNAHYEGTLGELPPDLLTQESTARAYLASFLNDYDNRLGSFEVLERQPYEYEEELLSLYWFRFTVEGEETVYLGGVSQPADAAEVAIYPTLFDYSDTPLTDANFQELKRELMDAW